MNVATQRPTGAVYATMRRLFLPLSRRTFVKLGAASAAFRARAAISPSSSATTAASNPFLSPKLW